MVVVGGRVGVEMVVVLESLDVVVLAGVAMGVLVVGLMVVVVVIKLDLVVVVGVEEVGVMVVGEIVRVKFQAGVDWCWGVVEF